MSSSDVAIVEPPPEMRYIVEGTARFISNSLVDMEKILANHKDDPDLCFLKNSDPYHAFYKKTLSEYRAKNQKGAPVTYHVPMESPVLPPPPQGIQTRVPPPEMRTQAPPLPPPQEPEPKVTLVPQDKFLAQHPGPSTISVYVPTIKRGKLIEVTVQSLSETVGSLKEKLAALYRHRLTTDRLKLIGNIGYLSDSMSFAHYNVGPGEILTLEIEGVVQSREELFNRIFNNKTV